MTEEKDQSEKRGVSLPSVEQVQRELAKAKSMDDFFGKEGIYSSIQRLCKGSK